MAFVGKPFLGIHSLKNGIPLFLLRKVVDVYHLLTKTRWKAPRFDETPHSCESIATINFPIWVRLTSQREAVWLTTDSFFTFLLNRRVGGQILSLVCGLAFYVLRVRTTLQQGQPRGFLMFIGVSWNRPSSCPFILWQSQTGSRPLKVFPSQSTHALENCHITIRRIVHPDFHIGSRQSQVESIDHWWTEQPWHLAENDGHEPPVTLRVRWGTPIYSDWVK